MNATKNSTAYGRITLSGAVPHARRHVLALLLALLGLLAAPAVMIASPQQVVDDLPATLQKYVADSAAWKSSPWMVIPTCVDRGGDFSLWAISVIRDTPDLLAHFQPSAFGADADSSGGNRNQAILEGYRKLGDNALDMVPAGLCVNDVKRWAEVDPQMKPFGFSWGVAGQQTNYQCTDGEADGTRAGELNRHLGAERAPCDGFAIPCDNAKGADRARCAAWNAFSDDYVRQVEALRREAIAQHPAVAQATVQTRTTWLPMAAAGAVGLIAVLLLLVMRHRTVRQDRSGGGR
jgi:hypothetical protein